MARPLPIAVLLSGEGTTLDAIADAIDAGELPARIVLVLSDRTSAGGVEKARRRGLAVEVRSKNAAEWAVDVDRALRAAGTELVVLAGFLSTLPPLLIDRWRGRIVNVHPSLLPSHGGPGMYGLRVHDAVLAAQEPSTGATVHLVTETLDEGPILLSERIVVAPAHTAIELRDRVRPVERRLLIEAIRRFQSGEWPLPYLGANRSLDARTTSARDDPTA